MGLYYGFYNSVNGDRRYDAEDFNRFFDGILTDGVLRGYGEEFRTRPLSTNANAVYVGTGRAWVGNKWTYCTGESVTLSAPGTSTRYDRVYLEVDANARVNSIKAVEGGSDGALPSIPPNKTNYWSYPIARVKRTAGATAINPLDIFMEIPTYFPYCRLMPSVTSDQLVESPPGSGLYMYL